MHLDSLLFILLIAVAILFQLLSRMASKARQEGENSENETRESTPVTRTRPVISRAPVESDQERIRKFLEALGQPATSRPPAPVVPRTDIPPRPLAPVQPPTASLAPPWKLTREEPRKRIVILEESPGLGKVAGAEEIAAPQITIPPTFEVHEGPLPAELPSIIKTPVEVYAATARPVIRAGESGAGIATMLTSVSGLRDAVILREILGLPRGLQALDVRM